MISLINYIKQIKNSIMKMNKATLIDDKGQICFTHFEVVNNGNILAQQFRTPLFTIKGKGVIKKIYINSEGSSSSDPTRKTLNHLFIADGRTVLKCDLYKEFQYRADIKFMFQLDENIPFDTSFEIIPLNWPHYHYKGYVEYVIYE